MGDSARLCLFCLEKRTNRQKIFCVENLFSCECKVYCHPKCIKKWHNFCGDDLQCPICRRSISEDAEDYQENQIDIIERELIIIEVEIENRQKNIKKIMVFLFHCISFLFFYYYVNFTFLRSS
jgi:hypothetical protein